MILTLRDAIGAAIAKMPKFMEGWTVDGVRSSPPASAGWVGIREDFEIFAMTDLAALAEKYGVSRLEIARRKTDDKRMGDAWARPRYRHRLSHDPSEVTVLMTFSRKWRIGDSRRRRGMIRHAIVAATFSENVFDSASAWDLDLAEGVVEDHLGREVTAALVALDTKREAFRKTH